MVLSSGDRAETVQKIGYAVNKGPESFILDKYGRITSPDNNQGRRPERI